MKTRPARTDDEREYYSLNQRVYALCAPFYDLVQALPSRRGSPESGLRSPAFITLLMATDMNIQYLWVRDDIHTTFERMIYSW